MGAVILLQAAMSAPNAGILNIGMRLALIGMGTVFIGLVILSISLPLIRKLAEKKKENTDTREEQIPGQLTGEEVVAITTAIHAHLLRINKMEDMKLTWEMYERPYSPWRLAGRSKLLMDRTAPRRRSR
jgi:Na+-transporting methylmalonyl-CoA/oxaloacetate decarboxylase gamma subunit